MATRTWRFDLDGQTHTVELEHGVLTGKRILRVDGQVLVQSYRLLHLLTDFGSRHPFRIGEHQCLVRIRLRAFSLLGYQYALTVDGRPIPWLPVRPQPGGCLVAWLVLVVLVNIGTIISYLVGLPLGGALGMEVAPWMGLATICFPVVSLI